MNCTEHYCNYQWPLQLPGQNFPCCSSWPLTLKLLLGSSEKSWSPPCPYPPPLKQTRQERIKLIAVPCGDLLEWVIQEESASNLRWTHTGRSSTVSVFDLFNTCMYTTINHCLVPHTLSFQKCVVKEIMMPEVKISKRGGESSDPPGTRQTETPSHRWIRLGLTLSKQGER